MASDLSPCRVETVNSYDDLPQTLTFFRTRSAQKRNQQFEATENLGLRVGKRFRLADLSKQLTFENGGFVTKGLKRLHSIDPPEMDEFGSISRKMAAMSLEDQSVPVRAAPAYAQFPQHNTSNSNSSISSGQSVTSLEAMYPYNPNIQNSQYLDGNKVLYYAYLARIQRQNNQMLHESFYEAKEN